MRLATLLRASSAAAVAALLGVVALSPQGPDPAAFTAQPADAQSSLAYRSTVAADSPAAFLPLTALPPADVQGAVSASTTGSPSIHAGVVGGEANGALLLTSSPASTLTSSRSSTLEPSGASGMTVEAWIAPSNSLGSGGSPLPHTGLFWYGSPSQPAYGVALDAQGKPEALIAYTPRSAPGTIQNLALTSAASPVLAVPTTGHAHHLVETYDGNTLRLYVNNTLVLAASLPGTIAYTAAGSMQGLQAGPLAGGVIEDLAVYARALSPARISARYTVGTTYAIGGTTVTTPSPSPTPTPTATPSAAPSLTPSPTPTPSVAPSITPTPSAAPSITPTPSAAPSVTPTPSPSPSPSAAPTPTPSPSVAPTPTPSVAPTPTPSPAPSMYPAIAWPVPSDTPYPYGGAYPPYPMTKPSVLPTGAQYIYLGTVDGDTCYFRWAIAQGAPASDTVIQVPAAEQLCLAGAANDPTWTASDSSTPQFELVYPSYSKYWFPFPGTGPVISTLPGYPSPGQKQLRAAMAAGVTYTLTITNGSNTWAFQSIAQTTAQALAQAAAPYRPPHDFIGAFARPYGQWDTSGAAGINQGNTNQPDPAPYPSPNGTLFGTSGYCDAVASNGQSITSAYPVDYDKMLDMVQIGVQWTRTNPPPFFLDHTHIGGGYLWGQTDATFCALLRNNIKPVVDIENGPVYYNAAAPTQVPTYKNPTDFANYCGALAQHVHNAFPSVYRFSIPGNEINSYGSWDVSGTDNPSLYAGYLGVALFTKPCYQAIKNVNPNYVVYFGKMNLDANADPYGYFTAMYNNGCKIGVCFDAFTVHLTALLDPLGIFDPLSSGVAPGNGNTVAILSGFTNALVRLGETRPVHFLLDEGMSYHYVPNLFTSFGTGSEADQVTYATRMMAAMERNPFVDGVSYANIDEGPSYPSTSDFAYADFVDNQTVYGVPCPRPVYHALQPFAGIDPAAPPTLAPGTTVATPHPGSCGSPTPAPSPTPTPSATPTPTPTPTPSPLPSGGLTAVTIALSPYAYYRMNETSGTIAFDSSGNGRNATYGASTVLGSTAVTPNDTAAVTLDGTTNAVITTPITGVNWSAYTTCVWYRPSSLTSPQGSNPFLLSNDIAWDVNKGMILAADNFSAGYFGSGYAGPVGAGGAPALGVNHQICSVYNGSTITTYTDGAAGSSAAASGALVAGDSPLTFGDEPHYGLHHYQGVIAEGAIWNSALSGANIAAMYAAGTSAPALQTATLAANPYLYYRGQEAVGSALTAVDYTTNQRNGTYSATGVTLGGTALTGNDAVSPTYLLGGLTTPITAGATAATGGQFGACAWVKFTSFAGQSGDTGNPRIAANANTASDTKGFDLSVLTSGNQVRFSIATSGSGVTTITGTTALTTGTRYFVCGTYNGASATLYVNGTAEATAAAAGNLVASTAAVAFGVNPATSASHAYGTLSEESYYTTAPTPTQIALMYSAGTTGPGTIAYASVVAADSPQYYYPLQNASPAGIVPAETTHSYGGYVGTNVAPGPALVTSRTNSFKFPGSTWQNQSMVWAPNPLPSAMISATNAFTVDAWINPTTATVADSSVIKFGDNTIPSYQVVLQPTTEKLQCKFTIGGTLYTATSAGALTHNAVHHVACVYNGANIQAYVDGAPTGTATAATGNISWTSTPGWAFGASPNNNGDWNTYAGYISDVATYASALPSTRIAAHFNAGYGQPAAPAPSPSASASSGGAIAHIHTFTQQSEYGDDPLTVSGFNWSQATSFVDWVEDINNNNTIATQAPGIGRVIYSDPWGTCQTVGWCADRPPATSYNTSTDFLQCSTGGVMTTPYTADTRLIQGDPRSSNFVTVTKAWETTFNSTGGGADYFHLDDMMFPEELNGYAANCPGTKSTAASVWKFGDGTAYSDSAYQNATVLAINQLVKPVMLEGACNGDGTSDNAVGTNNAATDPSGQWQWGQATNAVSVMCEKFAAQYGGPPNASDDTHLQVQVNTQIAVHSISKKFIAWTYLSDGATSSDYGVGNNLDMLYQVMAQLFLGYDSTYDYILCRGCAGSSKMQIHTAELFVPTGPLQTPVWPTAKVSTLKQGNGTYRREFSACYMNNTLVGRCATIVNPTSSSQAIQGLTQTYSHMLTMSGLGIQTGNYGTTNHGDTGAVSFTSAAPTSVPGRGSGSRNSVILLQ